MRIRSRWLNAGVTAVALGAVVTGTALAQAPSDSSAVQDGSEADVEEQEPALNGSITVADDESESEADEADRLSKLDGLIGEDAAVDAATGGGDTATDGASLENENGSVVYEVVVTRDDGTVQEVKVDAGGDGNVLAREDEDAEEADDSDEDDEAEDDEDDDVEHENDGDEGDHTDA